MNIIYRIILFPYYCLYLVLLKNKKGNSMAFAADIARAKSNFWDLMRNGYYRSLYYHRFYHYIKLFKPFLMIDKSFSLPETQIGEGCCLVHPWRTILNAESIGKGLVVFHNVTIGCDDYGHRPKIGNNVVLFTNAMVFGKVTVGDNARIGAGCVVVHNVPANCTVIGNPARIVKIDGHKVNTLLSEYRDSYAK